MFKANIRPFRSSGVQGIGTTSWEKIWSKRRRGNFKNIVAILYGSGGSANARFEFTFDEDSAIEANNPKFERWALGNVAINDAVAPPIVANDELPSPTGFRVVVNSGTVFYVVVGR